MASSGLDFKIFTGGADRDRTDDLLNAIRSRYILADWLLVTFW
jgi:hypothetical protein